MRKVSRGSAKTSRHFLIIESSTTSMDQHPICGRRPDGRKTRPGSKANLPSRSQERSDHSGRHTLAKLGSGSGSGFDGRSRGRSGGSRRGRGRSGRSRSGGSTARGSGTAGRGSGTGGGAAAVAVAVAVTSRLATGGTDLAATDAGSTAGANAATRVAAGVAAAVAASRSFGSDERERRNRDGRHRQELTQHGWFS